jgi:methylated-DNA-[protein]-cysteine S-methyltransferase
VPQLSLHSPLGALTVSQEDEGLVALDWGWGCDQEETALLRRAREQLHAYFDGELQAFDLPLAPAGSVFRLKVWDALRRIPFGTTRTYTEIAREIGGCARAIGQANRNNPLPILIPCHRVVAKGGIGGFTGEGGTDTKRFLLDHEKGI